MENGTQNLERGAEHSARQSHLKPFGFQVVPVVFDTAIRALVPSGRHNEICALFDRRVSYSAIKFWRYGKRPLPQWARDMLYARLSERRARFDHLMTRLEQTPIAQGRGSHRNIVAWNKRRAALAAKKKDPPS